MVRIGGPSARPQPTVQESGQTETVKKGDTLSGIAERHNVSTKDLLKANPQIKDPNKISPGQELKIPLAGRAAGGTGAAATSAASSTAAPPPGRAAAPPVAAHAGRLGGPKAAVLQQGSRGPQVTSLQQQLNEWRVRNGKSPIKEDGIFGPKTRDATKDFQKANGLKEDGISGRATNSRLDLENDSNFQKLNDATKTQVRKQMTDHGQDSSKIQNLSNLATSPGFNKLSTAHQKQMLNALAKRPTDKKFAGELQTLADSKTFRGLSDADKTSMLNNVSKHGSAADYLKSLSNDKLLSLAESPSGPKQLAALREAIQSGGVTRAEQAQLDRIGAATFTPGVGMRVNGSAADRASFLHMTRRAMLNSPSFRRMMNTANNDAAHPLNITVGRNQANHFVDAFNGGGRQTLDLADMERWPQNPPAGNPDAMTREQNIVHALVEARQGALGNGYNASHRRAIQAENQYRADVGQRSRLRMPPNDTTTGPGGSVIFQYNNGYREEVQTDRSGSNITGINRHNPPTP